ncbi:MAG: bifunctional metallophosphatase/5'-nucleotidase, partial [Gemmatimonadaceae bacterium]|nr:bifunctional metallophosphatase/5'-nucleotidase [Acetobacteraceae bacterium]
MTLTRRSLFIALGTLPLTRVARGQPAHRITILHVNDFHSRHEAVDARAMACTPDRAGCFGGAARLATAIRA